MRRRETLAALRQPHPGQRRLDGALAAAAAPLARWIADPRGGLLHPLWFLAGGGITLLLGGLPFRLSQQYWRFSGLSDLVGVVGGSIASAALFAMLLVATGFHLPTVTFPIVHALTLMVLLGARGWATGCIAAGTRRASDDPDLQRVVLVGAGDAADGFIRAATADPRTGCASWDCWPWPTARPGGVCTTCRSWARSRKPRTILAGLQPAPPAICLVVTEPEFLGAPLASADRPGRAAGIPVRRAPRPTALTAAERIELRPVAIEDLLNRPQVSLDRPGMARLMAGRRVLVTGAGGSIGSETGPPARCLEPACLVLLDQSEYALWQIDVELSELAPDVPRRAVIADIREAARISAVFAGRATRTGVSRGGAEARADGGGQPAGRAADQCRRHPHRGRRRRPPVRRPWC